MKKLFALLLAVVMVLGLVACVQQPVDTTPSTTDDAPQGTTTQKPTTTEDPGVQFPLEEKVTLTLTCAIKSDVLDLEKSLANNKLWQDLFEKTNVEIVIKRCDSIDTLTALLQTGNYGDIIGLGGMGGSNETVLSELIATKKLLPLNDYVNNAKIMPYFNERVNAELPEAKGTFTSPDGNLYVLGTYDAEISTYLENSIYINKTWLDKAGMTVADLATIAGVEKFFDWISKNDPNGDGKQNEVGYMCYQMGSFFVEALLGCWGLPTKDAANENYITIEDGEVLFVPQTDAYKDFLTVLNKWHTNGWMDQNYIKGNDSSTTKVNYNLWEDTYRRNNTGLPVMCGMYTSNGLLQRCQDLGLNEDGTPKNTLTKEERCEWVTIAPFQVEGCEVEWYIHPGFMGSKGNVAVASNCAYPEIACAWIDLFYSQDVTERAYIGEVGSKWVKVEGDKIAAVTLDNTVQAEIITTAESRLSQIMGWMPKAVTAGDYADRLLATESTIAKREAYDFYKDYINPEPWPRPYMTTEASAELSEMKGDIDALVAEYRAAAIAGTKNLTSDWDAFQAALDSCGIDDYVAIMQDAYDVWLEGQS